MITATFDDEQPAVSALLSLLNKIDPKGTHRGFTGLGEFMDLVGNDMVDIAFIDIGLGSALNGLELARHLMENFPYMNVIIYTGQSDPAYKAEALRLYVSGYLEKPVSEEELREAIINVRKPIRELYVQCFGYFEVFFGTAPVRFERKDSKEVFAFLIDKRGAMVSEEELRFLIFKEADDGDEKRTYIRNIIYDIRKTLAKHGVPKKIITNSKNCYGVERAMLRCDYYDHLDGMKVSSARLRQYMEQYPWAEPVRKNLFG
ncbi:MAG: response regulator [Ruminococcus sp.]|nr:response regulator [Ruminococcus sp.]